MNITKELYDALIALGFTIESLSANQTSPRFLVVTKPKNEYHWEVSFRIPNGLHCDLQMVISLLISEVHDRSILKGITQGKREVGQYIKNLIEQ